MPHHDHKPGRKANQRTPKSQIISLPLGGPSYPSINPVHDQQKRNILSPKFQHSFSPKFQQLISSVDRTTSAKFVLQLFLLAAASYSFEVIHLGIRRQESIKQKGSIESFVVSYAYTKVYGYKVQPHIISTFPCIQSYLSFLSRIFSSLTHTHTHTKTLCIESCIFAKPLNHTTNLQPPSI